MREYKRELKAEVAGKAYGGKAGKNAPAKRGGKQDSAAVQVLHSPVTACADASVLSNDHQSPLVRFLALVYTALGSSAPALSNAVSTNAWTMGCGEAWCSEGCCAARKCQVVDEQRKV